MFMEIAFIQKFVLFLRTRCTGGSRVVCFLRLPPREAGCRKLEIARWQAANKVTLAVGAMGVLALPLSPFLPGLFHALIICPMLQKYHLVALIAPLAMCMGVPFPTAMMRSRRRLKSHSVGMGDQRLSPR